jgi:hypothetical protein
LSGAAEVINVLALCSLVRTRVGPRLPVMRAREKRQVAGGEGKERTGGRVAGRW